MSVSSHLHIDLREYDTKIRTFVPHYETMLDVVAETLRAVGRPAPRLVELGVGSGALAERCLDRWPRARLTGIDADPGMLAQAAQRLARFGRRVTLVAGDFGDAASETGSPCDAAIASLALHHVHTPREKQRVYRQLARALAPGGLLINADVMLPDDGVVADDAMRAWRRHMEESYSAAQTRSYLRAWAGEDTYFPLSRELDWLRRAGLAPDVVWRTGAFAVVAARRA